jgi:uroporphyrinogen-III decarboxylase
MNSSDIYNEKLQRINDVVNRKIPDRVPVVPNAETYVYQYAGVSLKDAFTKDPEIAIGAFKKFSDDIYVDALLGNSNIVPLDMMQLFGEGLYTVDDKRLQIKGSQGLTMTAEDYPSLIEDFQKFITDDIIPRKYPVFNNPANEVEAMLVQAFDRFKEFGAYNGRINTAIEQEIGLPMLTRGGFYIAPDIVLDFLRDFVGISTDIRRKPNELLAASQEIYDFVLKMLLESYKTPDDGHIVFSPLHVPTFLKPKDFEKFYFPFMKRYFEEVSGKMGYSLLCYMENNWEPYLDIMQDLPDNVKVIGLFEHGDMALYKEKLDKKMTIMGGMPISLLKMGTKQQCIDRAKECLDLYAPGGNYIFSVDMVLMNLDDVNTENLIATFEYVHENGKY